MKIPVKWERGIREVFGANLGAFTQEKTTDCFAQFPLTLYYTLVVLSLI